MLKELTQQDFGVETVQGVVLVDFYAGRCTPCQILGKLMPHLAEKYEGQAVVAKVDTQSQAALAQRLMITGLPTVVVFKDGEEVDRLRGLQPPEAYSALLDKRVSTD